MARIERADVDEAIETIGELVSWSGGEGEAALDLLKDVAFEFFRLSALSPEANGHE